MAAEDKDLQFYFDHVVKNYNCGDIRELLDKKLDKCGPLLLSTVSGIDTVGGMISGFSGNNSGKRSVDFMQNYLNIDQENAALIYTCARCGLAHEGVTKLNLGFFVHYDRLDPGSILYKENDDIWLNVTELAWAYLDAVEEIGKNIHSHLSHVPEHTDKDRNIFQSAHSRIKKDIYEFGKLIEDLEAGGAQYRSSSSPFVPEDRLTYFKLSSE